MFSSLNMFGADPILALAEQFKNDSRLNKVNMTVGVYCDETGAAPVMDIVQVVEQELAQKALSKVYLPICGSLDFHHLFQQHLLPDNSRPMASCYTLGGTGGLKMVAKLFVSMGTTRTIWCSNPTWNNHISLFQDARINYQFYPYQHQHCQLDLDAMLNTLQQAQAGDLVLLHGSCHNPTGVDLTQAQWLALFQFMQDRQLIPLFDIAYDGFNQGLGADLWSLRQASTLFDTLIAVYSFSKVLTLYGERAGAVLIQTGTIEHKNKVQSNLERIARCSYSTPPLHGACIVETILANEVYKDKWCVELATYRQRIIAIRELFTRKLAEEGLDFPDIAKQRGIFSLLPITSEQARRLRDEKAVYLLDNGRINVAGLNLGNIDYTVEAFKVILKKD